MILIRDGVFETNSSSAHSLAYKNEVLRDYRCKTNGIPYFSDKRFHLIEKPYDYRLYSFMPLYFDEYGWEFKVLSSPAQKLSYLMSSVYQYKTWGVIKEDPFFKQVIQWLNELGVVVELPDEYGDSSTVDAFVDHQSWGVIDKSMFQTKEDLLTYLFNDDIVIHTENDNSNAMQNWVDAPEHTITYQQAMYWCSSQDKCVRRKSWHDGLYLIYGLVEDEDGQYISVDYLLVDGNDKILYEPSTEDKNANDWEVSLEVNKYEINP